MKHSPIHNIYRGSVRNGEDSSNEYSANTHPLSFEIPELTATNYNESQCIQYSPTYSTMDHHIKRTKKHSTFKSNPPR